MSEEVKKIRKDFTLVFLKDIIIKGPHMSDYKIIPSLQAIVSPVIIHS
jgi:hypothetical protein